MVKDCQNGRVCGQEGSIMATFLSDHFGIDENVFEDYGAFERIGHQ